MSLPLSLFQAKTGDSPCFSPSVVHHVEAALFPSQLLIYSPNNITLFFLESISTPHSSLIPSSNSFPTFKSSIIYNIYFQASSFKLQNQLHTVCTTTISFIFFNPTQSGVSQRSRPQFSSAFDNLGQD